MIRSVLILLSVSFLFACSKPSSPDEHAQKINRLLEQGETSAAIIEAKDALQSYPNETELRLLLARALVKRGAFDEGISQFERTGAVVPQAFLSDFLEAKYFTLEIEQKDEALALLDVSLSQTLNQDAILQALVNARITGANAHILNLETLAVSADDTLNKLVLALVGFVKNNQSQDFVDALQEVASDPAMNQEGWFTLLLGQSYYRTGDYAKAAEQFSRLVAMRPAYPVLGLTLAESHMRNDDNQAARAIVMPFLKSIPEQPIANQIMARIAYEDENLVDAKRYIEQALAGGFENKTNLVFAGQVNFELGNFEQAIRFLSSGLDGANQYTEWHEMLDYARAFLSGSLSTQELEQMQSIANRADILRLKSLLDGYTAAGNSASSDILLSKLSVPSQANYDEAFETLLLKQDKSQLPSQALNEVSADIVSELNYNEVSYSTIAKAKIINANQVLNEQGAGAAIKLVEGWINEGPADPINAFILADMNIVAQKWDAAVAALDTFNPINPKVAYRLSQIHFVQEQYAAGREIVVNSLSVVPHSKIMLEQYVKFEQALKTRDASFVAGLYQNKGDEADLIHHASYHAMYGDFDKAYRILNSPEETTGFTPYYSYLKAENALASGNKQAAVAIANKLRESAPFDIDMFNRIASLLSDLALESELLELYAKQFEQSNQNVRLLTRYLQLLFNQGELSRLIDIASKSELSNETSMQLTAIALKRLGKLQEANRAYTKLIEAYNTESSTLVYAQYLYDINEQTRAQTLLGNFIQANPLSLQARLFLASKVDEKEAMKLMEEALKVDPNSVAALTNYAYLLNQSGSQALAIESIDKAISLEPNNELAKSIKQTIQASNN